jgi:hypothetical protein
MSYAAALESTLLLSANTSPVAAEEASNTPIRGAYTAVGRVQEIDRAMLLGKLHGRAARFQRSRDRLRCICIALMLWFALM